MTNQITELQWIRALVLERQREANDIPTWLALEWVEEAIRRSSDEPTQTQICHWRACNQPLASGDSYLCAEHRAALNREVPHE